MVALHCKMAQHISNCIMFEISSCCIKTYLTVSLKMDRERIEEYIHVVYLYFEIQCTSCTSEEVGHEQIVM